MKKTYMPFRPSLLSSCGCISWLNEVNRYHEAIDLLYVDASFSVGRRVAHEVRDRHPILNSGPSHKNCHSPDETWGVVGKVEELGN